MTIMSIGIRLHEKTKQTLDWLRGSEYTADEMINMLIDNFVDMDDDDDDDDDDQLSLFDFDDDEDEE